jgi:Cu-processing system permease protein
MLIAVILNVFYLLLLLGLGTVLWNAGFDELVGGVRGANQREMIGRFLLGFAIAGASTLALFTGLFSSVGTIANEIERGTILAVAARPVSRWEIVAGKFLGNALLAVCYLVIQGIVIGLIVAALLGVWLTDLLVALALLALNILIMVALAVAGSTRLPMVANGIVLVVAYLGISQVGILYAIGTLSGELILRDIADWSRLALPVPQVSDLASQILSGPLGAFARSTLQGQQVLIPTHDWIWIYALAYLLAVLGLACWSLARRDLR